MSTDGSWNCRIDPGDLPEEKVIFGFTSAMREIRRKIGCVVSNNLPVLIQGESGTGKEVVARFLHTCSNWHDAPFATLNCAAIPANILESKLFGFEKGFYAGTKEARKGLVEIVEGGTLFLDQIGDMHRELQAKLLRLLQDGSYTRIGGSEVRHGHIRVICAANSDLKSAVDSGMFRDDLYNHIGIVALCLPALRERKCDIPLLCEYFLAKLARQFGKPAPQVHPATLALLQKWDWPGNMRELENWTARIIILRDEAALAAELQSLIAVSAHLYERVLAINPPKEMAHRAVSSVTNAQVIETLRENHWNRWKTAKELNMSYRLLLFKLREVGIPQRRRSHKSAPPAF